MPVEVKEDKKGRHWRPRPWASRLVRLVALTIPVVAAAGVSLVLGALLPTPTTVLATILWWLAVLGAAFVTLVLVERLARRLLPLATLLKLSLVFPDQAPSRFAVARKAHTVEDLRRRASGDEEEAHDAAAILTLVADLQRHDRATRGHSERVRVYVDMIADELKLAQKDRDRLAWVALLHDVGKIGVPAALLNKPGPPDNDEWARLRRHPDEGMRLAAPLQSWLGDWRNGIRDHHERYDGSGYPRGLQGEQISTAGRIVAVADAYEAMTASRPYKRPFGVSEAREELVRQSGAHFDPAVVRAFLNVSIGRLRRTLGFGAFLVQLPFLYRLRPLPETGVPAMLASTVLAGLVVTGVLVPGASGSQGSGPDRVSVAMPGEDGAQEPPGGPGDAAAPRTGGAGQGQDAGLSAPRVGPGATTPAGGGQGGGAAGGAASQTPATGQAPPGGTGTDPAAQPAAAPPPPGSGLGGLGPSGPPPPGGAPPPPPTDAPPPPPPPPPPPSEQVPRLGDLLTLSYYLDVWTEGDTPSRPLLPLSASPPGRQQLANYDTDRDASPGLLLRRTDRGLAETDPARRQSWASGYDRFGVAAGFATVTFWSALPGFTSGPATLDISLQACTGGLDNCDVVGQRRLSEQDWSRGQRDWVERSVDVALTALTVDADRVLLVTFTVDASSSNDMWLAYGTQQFPSSLSLLTVLPPLPLRSLPVPLPIIGVLVDDRH